MDTTPLASRHESLGARFTEFGGWSMPVQYEGVIAEHTAVRESVGVFDVSHLGRFRVGGPGSQEALGAELCNDIAKCEPGRAQYTMALNDRGGVDDDIIVWRFADDAFWLMPNGTNLDEIYGRFASRPGVEVAPRRRDTVLLAVQGPQAPVAIEHVLGSAPGRFRVATGAFAEGPYWAAGTGYTGEPGAEIAVPVGQGARLLDAFLDAGAVPCGLGARDTLRLEMGYPLWGQDLDETTSPLEAGLSWVVAWDHEFVGRPALQAQRDRGLAKQLIAFRTQGRVIPRHGYPMRAGASVGAVSSGNFSPTLGHGIGMGYLAPPLGDGGEIEVQVRGAWHTAEIVKLPFLPR